MSVMTIEFLSGGQGKVIDLRPSHLERLVGKLFEVFELACDLHDIEAADDILQSARSIIDRNGLPMPADKDKTAQMLVDAHYRLWELRYVGR